MFKENLSRSLLQICDTRKLSYEAAAELCDISPRHMGSILRGQTSPNIMTLEKICMAFERSPNELLQVVPTVSELSYRIPMLVTDERKVFLRRGEYTAYAICPRCRNALEREFQAYCDRCGQMLDWIECTDLAPVEP